MASARQYDLPLALMPDDPLAGTGLDEFPRPVSTNRPPVQYVDVSLATPDQQFEALAGILANNDLSHPAPVTSTPPWGEESAPPSDWITERQLAESYLPVPDLETDAQVDVLDTLANPWPIEFFEFDHNADPQYHGLGVPPGVQNLDQPVESGHTQITPNNPSAEAGWDAWSGRNAVARVSRHENDFPRYGADVDRHYGARAPIKLEMPYALLTQQYRDMLLAELKRRGVHNVVIADVPSVPFTEQIAVTDPTILNDWSADIGPEGLLPFDEYYGSDHPLAAGGGV